MRGNGHSLQTSNTANRLRITNKIQFFRMASNSIHSSIADACSLTINLSAVLFYFACIWRAWRRRPCAGVLSTIFFWKFQFNSRNSISNPKKMRKVFDFVFVIILWKHGSHHKLTDEVINLCWAFSVEIGWCLNSVHVKYHDKICSGIQRWGTYLAYKHTHTHSGDPKLRRK